MMKVLVAVSGGILDPMMKAVTYAAARAVETGVERITIALLEDALDNPPAWVLDEPEPLAAAA